MEMTNEEIEKALLAALNKRGFILEERTWNVLDYVVEGMKEANRTRVLDREGERIEIDAYACTSNLELIIECKRTVNSWYFAKRKQNDIIDILYEYDGYKIRTRIVNHGEFSIHSSSYGMALSEQMKMTDNENQESQPIHKAVRQILKNVEAILQQDPKERKGSIAVTPIIVTNAELNLINYEENDITIEGELSKLNKIEKVDYLAFNFKQALYAEKGGIALVPHVNDDKDATDITVYIVNISALANFIKKYNDWIGLNRNQIIRT